jgi:TRAP-type uncharacterized transport system fused permease subunit
MTQELGLPLAAAYVVFKACLAIALWGAAAVGYLFRPLAWWERLFATAAAFSLVLAISLTDEIGFALSAAFVAQHLWRARRGKRVETAA